MFSLPDLPFQHCCLTVGNFDGVHRGHQQMVRQLVEMAQHMGEAAVAVTFDPPPLRLLDPDRCPPQLTTFQRRRELLLASGVDEVVVLPTTRELLGMTAEAFLDELLIERIGMRGIVEGPNFCFGRGRSGTVARLREMCVERSLPLEIVPAEEVGGTMVSSSAIRQAVQEGQVATARQMLGRPFEITGLVGQGAQRGRTIGFPTANLTKIETLLPAMGVYAGRAAVDGVTFAVALNIGPNPTFGEGQLKIEGHLVDFAGDLYGRHLTIELLEHLRGVIRFSSAEDLIGQLRQDVERTRAAIRPGGNVE